ncbi:MAG: NUDIX hydrolase [Pseudomonadota bacterium]
MSYSPKATILSRKVEFEGWHRLETVVVQPQSLKHDGLASPMSREVYYCGTVVGALLYLPETDQILLNEQFRVGAFMAGDPKPALYECSAGKIDEGEAPEAAVRREALEETGCAVLDLEFIGKSYPSPGGSDEMFLLYCGRIGKAEAGHYGLEREGEEIKTRLLPAAEAIRMLDAGEITNGSTVICLHWFARNHARLRQKWGGKQ